MSRGRGSALVTVLFTDIVGSTEIASELGNRRWRELLGRHHRIVRRELRRFRGREIDTAGDGFFATFDRPAQGIRCAWAVTDAVRALGIEVRAGLHTGEAELMGKQVGGVAVHVGARIGGQAGPGEVMVSATLRDLVPGTGLEFEDRGWRELKGVSEPQRLYALKAVDGRPGTAPLPAREASRRRAEIVPPAPFRRGPVLVGGVVLLALAVIATVVLTRGDGDQGTRKVLTAENAVVKIEPKSGMAGKPILLSSEVALPTFHAIDLQVGEGAVWVAGGRCLCRIDPATGEARNVYSRNLARSFDRMVLGLRAIWLSGVTGLGRPHVIGLDPVTLEVVVETEPLEVATTFSASVATGGGSVWLGFRHQLHEFDPQTGDPRGSYTLDVTVDGLVTAGDDLWIIDELGQALLRFDTDSGRIRQRVKLSVAPDEVAVEPDGTLWVLDELGGTLTRIDPGDQADAAVSVGTAPTDVAVGAGHVWIADGDGSAKEIDPITLEVLRAVDLPGEPDQISVDPRTGDVWVYLS
jgi:class 3 adenylate cyclase/DNA-binding beta-propeller fold protein YncE